MKEYTEMNVKEEIKNVLTNAIKDIKNILGISTKEEIRENLTAIYQGGVVIALFFLALHMIALFFQDTIDPLVQLNFFDFVNNTLWVAIMFYGLILLIIMYIIFIIICIILIVIWAALKISKITVFFVFGMVVKKISYLLKLF